MRSSPPAIPPAPRRRIEPAWIRRMWDRGRRRPDEAVSPLVELVTATAGNLVLSVAALGLNFLVSLVLARLLGAGGYGIFAYALAWAALLGVFAVLGLTPLVVRNVSAYHAHGEWGLLRGMLRRADQAVLAMSAALAAGAAVGGWFFIGPGDPSLLWAYWLGLLLLPLTALASLRQAAMQGFRQVVLGRMPETLAMPLVFLALVGCAWLARGRQLSAPQAVGLQVAATAVAFALGARLLRRTVSSEVKTAGPAYDTRAWARSALPLFLFSGIGSINAQTPLVLLGAMDDPEAVGLFSVASRGAMFVSFFFLAAAYPLAPRIARLHATGQREALQELLTHSGRVMTLCSLPMALALGVLAHPLLALFGREFGQARAALILLSAGEFLVVASGFNGLTLMMAGREREATWAMTAGTLLNVLVSVLLIPRWGLEGAALAASGSRLLCHVLLAWFLWSRLRLYAPALGPLRHRRPRKVPGP